MQHDTSSSHVLVWFCIILLVPRWFSAESLTGEVYRFCVFSTARFALLHFLMEKSSKSRIVGRRAISWSFRHWFSPNPKLMTWLLPCKDIQRCFFCSFSKVGYAKQIWGKAFGELDVVASGPLDIHPVFQPSRSRRIKKCSLSRARSPSSHICRAHPVGKGSCCEMLWDGVAIFWSRCLQTSPNVSKPFRTCRTFIFEAISKLYGTHFRSNHVSRVFQGFFYLATREFPFFCVTQSHSPSTRNGVTSPIPDAKSLSLIPGRWL